MSPSQQPMQHFQHRGTTPSQPMQHFQHGYSLADDPQSSSSCPEVRIDIPNGSDPDVDRFLEPAAASSGTIRCRVRRDRQKNRLELFIEEGNVFVLAAARQKNDWIISDMPFGSTAPRRHIARMRTHKDRNFTCVRGRDEGGSAPPELLAVRHSTEQLSEDLPELNTMQLALPRPPLGLLDAPSGKRAASPRVPAAPTRCRRRTPCCPRVAACS